MRNESTLTTVPRTLDTDFIGANKREATLTRPPPGPETRESQKPHLLGLKVYQHDQKADLGFLTLQQGLFP